MGYIHLGVYTKEIVWKLQMGSVDQDVSHSIICNIEKLEKN